jgi:hypothetical protein
VRLARWLLPAVLLTACVDLSLPARLTVGTDAADQGAADGPGMVAVVDASGDQNLALNDSAGGSVVDGAATGADRPGTDGASPPLDAAPRPDAPGAPGTCTPESNGAPCGTGSCSGATEQTAATCDGLGMCVPGYAQSCGGYLCRGTTCGVSCSDATQCVAGYTCSGGMCVAGAPLDGGSAIDATAGALVIDDFSDADLATNNLGGAVSSTNETATQAGGQVQLTWNGAGATQAFIEAFRANGCEYDAHTFTKVSFQLRSSAIGKRVAVLLGVGDGACKQSGVIRQTTITVSTTMTSYTVDISRTARNNALFVQLAPTAVDDTQYFIDDIVLTP